jgi:hypothetical protein
VHCKSKAERGVAEALPVCAGLYLRRVLAVSVASVLVVFGEKTREHLALVQGIRSEGGLFGPSTIEGRDRLVVFLPHPASWQSKTIATCFSEMERERLRAFVTVNCPAT